jgi:hypothetical protein
MKISHFGGAAKGHGAGVIVGEQGKATFCEQKVAKKLYAAGPEALSPTMPQAQRRKVFAPLLIEKAAASFF